MARPLITVHIVCSVLLAFLSMRDISIADVALTKTQGMKKDIPVSFDSERGVLISWIGEEKLDVGKGYKNSSGFSADVYSEQNCFNQETRTGPLFKEASAADDTNKPVERYFYLDKDEKGSIVPKYIDEEIQAGIRNIWIIVGCIAILMLFSGFLFLRRKRQSGSIENSND